MGVVPEMFVYYSQSDLFYLLNRGGEQRLRRVVPLLDERDDVLLLDLERIVVG